MARFGSQECDLEEENDIVETREGSTRLLVPRVSLETDAPPHKPAFYNPRAGPTRDMSVIACAAHAATFDGDIVVLESHAGLGARGIRIANEVNNTSVILNDLNPTALDLALRSAELNSCADRVSTSNDESCRFLSARAKQGQRGVIVDVDPFGSPAKYVDCAIRACAHGGLLSVTATDMLVLHGIFADACARRYGGVPIRRTPHAKETAIRLILGCIRSIAARMDITIKPVFCECSMHYYRAYMIIHNKVDTTDNLGMIHHCDSCGLRGVSPQQECECGATRSVAGPLWTGPIFDGEFTQNMMNACGSLQVDASCARTIERAHAESGLPACYYTLDEIASRTHTSPPRLDRAVERLKQNGHDASPTSLDTTALRTSARMPEIIDIFSSHM